MATSGTTTYSMTASQIITHALRKAMLVKFDIPAVPARLVTPYLESLNLLVKAWEPKGLHLWKRKRLRLTPVAYRSEYVLGATADAVVEEKFASQLIASAASADTTIDVRSDSATDLASGDTIDIYLSDGTVHTTTISGAPAGITNGYRCTLTTALDADADAGARVQTWKSSTDIPTQLVDAYQADTAMLSLIPLWVDGRNNFSEINDPRSTGAPMRVTFQRTTSGGRIRIWPEPIDSSLYVLLDCDMPIETFSSVSDNPDMPAQWYLALIYNLAKIMMDDNPDQPYPDAHRLNIIKGAQNHLALAEDLDWEPEHRQIELDLQDYYPEG